MSGTLVKGQSLRQNFEVTAELFGSEVLTRVLGRLSEPFRRAYDEQSLLVSGWYPVAWAAEFHRALMLSLPEVSDLPERIARRGVELDMKGIYGFLARLMTPEFCIKQAPRALTTYYKGPELTSKLIDSGCAQLYFKKCDGFTRSLWRELAAGSCLLMESAGASAVRAVYLEGGRDGDSEATLEVRWSKK